VIPLVSDEILFVGETGFGLDMKFTKEHLLDLAFLQIGL
jgi:hypothetical protein